MYPYLVADIGGTNARFALVTGKVDNKYVIEHVHVLSGKDYPQFIDAVEAYILGLPNIKPASACIAMAGPVKGDHVKMTNLDWSFSKREVQDHFSFSALLVINDYTAAAVSTTHLQEHEVLTIKQGNGEPTGNRAIFGPGTGLGIAGLVYSETGWVPIPSEGGHVNISISTPLEAEILAAALQTYDHVSAEVFLSGPGLVNIYKMINVINNTQADELTPKDVTSRALDGSDDQCVETLEVFCSLLGTFAGNIALTYGAKGGIFLTGGILPRISDFLMQSKFVTRFSSKGIMSHFVEPIPVSLVNNTQMAFVGAAAWLEQNGL